MADIMQMPDTFFASPERHPEAEIEQEHLIFISEQPFIEILEAISGNVFVLNEHRQIIYANEESLKVLGLDSVRSVLGKRPGEALGCIHATDMPAGCGTADACSLCGAVNAIIESQNSKGKVTNETRLTTTAGEFHASWDILVTSSPVNLNHRIFYVLSLIDISHEKRRQALEKIFFHDILNSAGSLNGLISILKSIDDPLETRKILDISESASRELIEEIQHHKQLRSAENGDLIVNFDLESASEMMNLAAAKIGHHKVGEGKIINTEDHSGGIIFETDRVLLQRIIKNMLKNALEATPANGTVNANVFQANGTVTFSVQNKSVMPKEIQMQIFQRSFSTKGKGRGTGTYSIKLLAENYLKGKAGFRSSEEEGTVFFVELPVRIDN
jgi:K+-sensing histidine kinase KdpD